MNAQELRIGNYIEELCFDRKEIVQVESLENGNEGIINNARAGFYLPIQLTEDWLLNFNFVRQGNREMWVKGKICVVLMDYPNIRGASNGNRFYIGYKDIGNVIYHTQFEVPHVHTLQNAYALSGQELILNKTV